MNFVLVQVEKGGQEASDKNYENDQQSVSNARSYAQSHQMSFFKKSKIVQKCFKISKITKIGILKRAKKIIAT